MKAITLITLILVCTGGRAIASEAAETPSDVVRHGGNVYKDGVKIAGFKRSIGAPEMYLAGFSVKHQRWLEIAPQSSAAKNESFNAREALFQAENTFAASLVSAEKPGHPQPGEIKVLTGTPEVGAQSHGFAPAPLAASAIRVYSPQSVNQSSQATFHRGDSNSPMPQQNSTPKPEKYPASEGWRREGNYWVKDLPCPVKDGKSQLARENSSSSSSSNQGQQQTQNSSAGVKPAALPPRSNNPAVNIAVAPKAVQLYKPQQRMQPQRTTAGRTRLATGFVRR